jgi:hypothetical protein
MFALLCFVLAVLVAPFKSKSRLEAENVALRHQLIVLRRTVQGRVRHLRRILRAYARYYNDIRTHRSLDKDAPLSRPVQRAGIIRSHAILGGLHHHYVRV